MFNMIIWTGIIGGMAGIASYLAYEVLTAPLGYEDEERGFINLDKVPDYVPADIMDLPDFASMYIQDRPYDYEVDGQ